MIPRLRLLSLCFGMRKALAISLPGALEILPVQKQDKTITLKDEVANEAGAFYVMNRSYLDFERRYASRSHRLSSWCAPRPISCCSGAIRIR